MKITQLMLAKGFGGAERLFLDLVFALDNEGYQVQAICQAGSEVEKLLKNHANINVETVRVFSTRDPFAWRKIAKAIKQFDSDIVQSHLVRGTYLAGKACRQLNKPLVVTLHNYINLKYYKNVTKFIPATRDQIEYLCANNIPEEKISLIPHFSHLEAVESLSFNSKEPFVFGSFGRMVRKKGFHVLIKAFNKLLESGVDAKLTLGGDGPEKESLVSLVKSLGLEKHVELVGWVEDVEPFLNIADCFVLPSLDEPFGIVVLEAMAFGKTIVSTKSQGPREVLNNKNAYLVEVDDEESMFLAMKEVVSNKGEAESRAKQALRNYKETYSKEVVIPQFLDLYRQTIKEQQV